MTRPRLRGRRNFDVTGRVFRKPKIPADEQGVRNAIHLVLTPILLFVGWAFLSSALVESAGPSGGIGGMLVAVGGLLTIPLGVAVGWHYRHRLPATVTARRCSPDPDPSRLVLRLDRLLGSSFLADRAGLDDLRPRGNDRDHRRVPDHPPGHRLGLASIPARVALNRHAPNGDLGELDLPA